MAQAAEQGGAHVLVAEEVESVIVVEVGRDAGPLSHHLARAKRASHPTAIPNTSRISCRQRAVLCLTHPGQQGFQSQHCLQCRTTCAVVKGKSRENLVDVDRTRAPRDPRATARWSTSREHTPGVFRERLRRHVREGPGDPDQVVHPLEEASLQLAVVQVVRQRPAQPGLGRPAAVFGHGPQANPTGPGDGPLGQPAGPPPRLPGAPAGSYRRRSNSSSETPS
jgi:hypothetical protein